MVKLFKYTDSKLPSKIKYQILSFLRLSWPEGFKGENIVRDWITKKTFHPFHFVLLEKNDLLVSYTGVVWKYLKHEGNLYKTYGLSAVFTYPSFRNQGHGLKIIKEAKKYIEESEADIVLFPSRITGFYEKAGFKKLNKAKLFEGHHDNTKLNQENIFMLFVSDKGKKAKLDFETKPIYFGEDIW